MAELSKADAARRQLVTAIRLYFNWGDEVSIHTLAAAARNVLCKLCEHRGVTHSLLLDRLLAEFVKLEHHKEFCSKFRESENFFKHADRDPEECLTFNPETTDYMLLEAVEAYTVLTGENVPELHAYRGWWLLHHQGFLKDAPVEFLRRLNGVNYAAGQRTQYLTDMLATMAQQY